ncbi:MAG: hypothetical protein GY820_37775 [Gammaproteobacteria bacterium]|nr:hypothetical protein [Gammaproteobacteria bacterium]
MSYTDLRARTHSPRHHLFTHVRTHARTFARMHARTARRAGANNYMQTIRDVDPVITYESRSRSRDYPSPC